MDKRKKTGGKDWQPGQSGNPDGRKPLSLEAREFRKASRETIIQEFKYLWNMTEDELKWIVWPMNDEPMIRKAIAKQLLKGQLEEVLNRVIGKPKEEIDLNHTGSLHGRMVAFMQRIENKTGEEVRHGDENKEIGENEETEDQENKEVSD